MDVSRNSISTSATPYQLSASTTSKSQQYIQLNLSTASAVIDKTHTASLKNLQESLQIECIKPASTWEWCCLQPSRLMGCYLSVRVDSGATIYVVRSSALKIGLKAEDLKTEKSFQKSCVNINKLMLNLPKETWSVTPRGGGLILAERAINLINLSKNLKEGESVEVSHSANKPSTILYKVAGGGLEIIRPEKIAFAAGGFASVHKASDMTNDYAIRVMHPQRNAGMQAAALEDQQNAQNIIALLKAADPDQVGLQKGEITRVVSCINSSTGETVSSSTWTQASISKLCLGDAVAVEVTDPGQKNLVAKQITQGLSTMHKSHIVHGDLKLENLLLEGTKDEDGKVTVTAGKIADFGGAVYLKGKNRSDIPGHTAPKTSLGDMKKSLELKRDIDDAEDPTFTEGQTAAEIENLKAKSDALGRQRDVFSMGIMLSEFYTGQDCPVSLKAIPGKDSGDLYVDFVRSNTLRASLKTTGLTQGQQDLIVRMVSTNPDARPSAQEVATAFA